MKNTETKLFLKSKKQVVPIDLRNVIEKNLKAKSEWNNLTQISQRDFIIWIDQAKQKETRKRRIDRTCALISKGKHRPCCFSLVPMGLYRALGGNSRAKTGWKKLDPNEKRDLAIWVESAIGIDMQKKRIEKVCKMLSSGRHNF